MSQTFGCCFIENYILFKYNQNIVNNAFKKINPDDLRASLKKQLMNIINNRQRKRLL